MKARVMKASLRRRADPRRDFHRAQIGGEQIGAALALALGEIECDGQGARGRMNHAARMRIVKIERVDQ